MLELEGIKVELKSGEAIEVTVTGYATLGDDPTATVENVIGDGGEVNASDITSNSWREIEDALIEHVNKYGDGSQERGDEARYGRDE